jgi:hypothetical protein
MKKNLAVSLPSPLVPRRAPARGGRRPPYYPDLNFGEIGRTLGLSGTYVGRVLNGFARPSLDVAVRLAALMGWTVEQVNALYGSKPKLPYGQSKTT